MTAVFWGLTLPFAGTVLGAACVFFMKGDMNDTLQRSLLGFAAGIMNAASIWSLLIPAIEMAAAAGTPAWIPALSGFA
ncbi:hypothetical protein [Treponema parvum]|uniref:hypothetical protein n=1 Tax=Treponema parvum TaxID=138851 RepID=UPI002115D912|nr:hypothetical protein [Treponema parvum]